MSFDSLIRRFGLHGVKTQEMLGPSLKANGLPAVDRNLRALKAIVGAQIS